MATKGGARPKIPKRFIEYSFRRCSTETAVSSGKADVATRCRLRRHQDLWPGAGTPYTLVSSQVAMSGKRKMSIYQQREPHSGTGAATYNGYDEQPKNWCITLGTRVQDVGYHR